MMKKKQLDRNNLILMLFSQNPTDANIFLPQCPMSEYNASAPVVQQNTKPKKQRNHQGEYVIIDKHSMD
jgi:hypothetical protein